MAYRSTGNPRGCLARFIRGDRHVILKSRFAQIGHSNTVIYVSNVITIDICFNLEGEASWITTVFIFILKSLKLKMQRCMTMDLISNDILQLRLIRHRDHSVAVEVSDRANLVI